MGRIHDLVKTGNVRSVSTYLDSVTDVRGVLESTDSSGSNALHYAAKIGNLLMVQLLLERSSSFCRELINKEDGDGKTPMFHSLCQQHSEILYLLLKEGGDLSIGICRTPEIDATTPFIRSISMLFTELKQLCSQLQSRPVDIVKGFLEGSSLMSARSIIRILDLTGKNILHHVVMKGRGDLVHMVLEVYGNSCEDIVLKRDIGW